MASKKHKVDGQICYSIPTAARLLDCSEWLVRRQIKCGQLRALRIGRRTLIRVRDLHEFLNSRCLMKPNQGMCGGTSAPCSVGHKEP